MRTWTCPDGILPLPLRLWCADPRSLWRCRQRRRFAIQQEGCRLPPTHAGGARRDGIVLLREQPGGVDDAVRIASIRACHSGKAKMPVEFLMALPQWETSARRPWLSLQGPACN